MSMLVRKATLVRPSRNRRGQSQRSSSASAATQGGGLFSRTSVPHSTFTGVSFLKSSGARKTAPGTATLTSSRPESEGRNKRGGLASSPSRPERRTFLSIPEQSAGLSRHGSSRHYNVSHRTGSEPPSREDDPEILLQLLRGRDSGGDSDQASVRSRDSPRHAPASGRDRNRTILGKDSDRQLQLKDSDRQSRNEQFSRDSDHGRQMFHRDADHLAPDGQFLGRDPSRLTLRKDLDRQPPKRDSGLQQQHNQNLQPVGRFTKDRGRQSSSRHSDRELRDSNQQQQYQHQEKRHQQFEKGTKASICNPDSSRHLLSPPGRSDSAASKPLGGPLPWKQYASSLKESELSKPRSDLPFTRADLPVRHSSLPARRLDSTLADSRITAADSPLPSVPFGASGPCASTGAASGSGVLSDRPQRHCSLPPRYLELPRSRVDFPLMRPDSEQAFRELAERHQQCRTLIASLCDRQARDAQAALSGEGEFDATAERWDDHYDSYQGGDGWRRSSVDNCQRSELLQQVVEANKEADSPCDFVCRVHEIVSTTIIVTVLLFCALTIPIVMISMGVKYMNDCPLEPRLPVYLLVGGCFLALKLLGMLWKNVQLRRYDSMDAFYDSPDSELVFTSRTFRMMDWILAVFLLAWHVVGACWVFALWQPPYRPSLHEPSRYCGMKVYMCAVCEIIGTGALLFLGLLTSCALALCYKYTSIFEQ